MTAPLSKLEYLKKYMSGPIKEEKKVKKKRLKPLVKPKGGVVIVDEDIDLRKIAAGYEKDEDQMDTQEDAPAIAGVIDDRPDDLKTQQDFVQSTKWRRLEQEGTSKTQSSSSDASISRRRPDFNQISSKKQRHDSDSDQSPPRRKQGDSDESPPRRERYDSGSDLSPPRRRKDPKLLDSDGDLSPVRPAKPSTSVDADGKMTRTLDGKIAGLQRGKDLRRETEELRRREEEAFRRMDKSLTGENAQTAVRAGKRREMEAKQQAEKEKAEKMAKLHEVYQKWNKGLKQVEERSARLEDDVHEMSKPLARLAGDEDLERMLREQEREGDPMAAYVAKKKAKTGGGKGPARPVYRGPAAAPNRFGILPGYRWDGVDRSNGFEKMYFEKQNKAVAIQEEAYKWSVAEM